MEFKKSRNETLLSIEMPSSLNPSTLEAFDSDVKNDLDGIKSLELDFKELEYISSSVLRLLIDLHLKMEEVEGRLTILHPNEEVMEVFTMTGLDKTLNIVK